LSLYLGTSRNSWDARREAYEEWQYWPVGFLEELIEANAYRTRRRRSTGTDEDPAR
jgi:hypothetical protein